jgi:hypothetical protein
MPVRDHFYQSEQGDGGWEGFHTIWIAHLTRSLNRRWLPAEFRAVPERYFGPVKADVGVVREPSVAYAQPLDEPSTAFELPVPDAQVPGVAAPFARVLVQAPGSRLVAVIELVSPANKDQPTSRDAFAGKMQSYLENGVSLIVVDLVGARKANLHNRWVELFGDRETPQMPARDDAALYVVAYRPHVERVGNRDAPRVDLWLRSLGIGDELPTLPLFIGDDLAVPIELEATYEETCGDLRLAAA